MPFRAAEQRFFAGLGVATDEFHAVSFANSKIISMKPNKTKRRKRRLLVDITVENRDKMFTGSLLTRA